MHETGIWRDLIADDDCLFDGAGMEETVVVVPPRARRVARGDEAPLQWERMIGRTYPLRRSTDLARVRSYLVGGWPHAAQVVDEILDDAAQRSTGGRGLTIAPTLLVGAPGAGKTRLAIDLGTALGLAPQLVGCGGISDGMFAGSNRRWSNSDACLPLNMIGKTGLANPMLILDELEKVGSGRTNGNLLDALLGMLDPVTAGTWHDPSVEDGVNLLHINWFFTANDVADLPAPLRDRLRILRMPAPTCDDLPALGRSVLDEFARTRGLDRRWLAPLSSEELEAIAEAWKPRSLRSLRRLVEGVIEARERRDRHGPLH